MQFILRNIVLLVFILIAPTAYGQLEAIHRGNLPEKQYSLSAVYDGQDSIYILGGKIESSLDQILRFNLSSNEISQVTRFPVPFSSGTAHLASDGKIYCAGAVAAEISIVWKFLPDEEPKRPQIVGYLPNRILYSSSAYDGKDGIYFFGGAVAEGITIPTIVKFNTSTNVSEFSGKLPFEVGGILSAADWSNGSAFIFGGASPQNGFVGSNLVSRFRPGEDNIAIILEAELVAGMWGISALAVGDNKIYVVGTSNSVPHHISRFDTTLETLEQFTVSNFPDQLREFGSVYIPKLNRIYVFGGLTAGEFATDKILSIDLTTP